MEQSSNNIVDIHYLQTGAATSVNALGMREMQALAYESRDKRFLLIKAPPASGKSRALMFIALDKLAHQGIKKVVVAVPEKSIDRSFKNTNLVNGGFFANWEVPTYFDLTDVKNEQDKKGRFIEFFHHKGAKVLVCAHATLRNATKELSDDTFMKTQSTFNTTGMKVLTLGKRYLRRYDALRLFVGYHEGRASALVQVKDITYNNGIVEYHLGLVLEVVK